MEIRSADRGSRKLYDGITGILNRGLRAVFNRSLSNAVEYKSLHTDKIRLWFNWSSNDIGGSRMGREMVCSKGNVGCMVLVRVLIVLWKSSYYS